MRGYLDRLKGMNLEKCLPSPLQKLQKPPFYSFCSTQGGRFQKIAPTEQVTPTPPRTCSTCAHVCRSGCCGEPVAAGLSDLEGVIRYSPDRGATCPAWHAPEPLFPMPSQHGKTQDRDQTERPSPSYLLETHTMLTVSAESSGTFELPPSGPTAARCCLVADLGSQESTFEGKTKLQRKILLSWELAEPRTDGSPFRVSRRFGLSLHENAGLRAFLQAWRGRPFTDEELAGFDLSRLAGVACLLNLAHVNRGGKDYANILSISPVPKGMTAPELSGPAIVFDIDAANAPDVLETLSDNLQATIMLSPEWQARMKTGNPPRAREHGEGDEAFSTLSDDVPW